MPFDESARARLLAKLRDLLGPEEAEIIMERLHPEDWSQLATKADLAALAADLNSKLLLCATKADLAELPTKADLAGFATKADLAGFATKGDVSGFATTVDVVELRGEVAELRNDVVHLREAVDLKLDAVESRLRTDLAQVRSEMHLALREQFARTITVLLPAMFSAVGLAFAAAKFS